MELDREYFLRLIKGRSAGAVVVEGSGESGGGGGGATLGPLLTSLNAEAMPVSEGYLHWSGTAWEWTTPTGGDPVDLTPYALKTWVQNNYATLNDISELLTKTQADGYYAPISFVKPYLPLAAGSSYPLTGSLYINGNNNGIQWSGDKGMLCYKPASGWSGVTSTQWGVGSHDADGIIRSGSALERYDGTNNYTIYDSSNLDPLNYLRKDGGTVAGTLNVKTLLNVQSSAGANKVTIDGSTANIDIASGGQITFDVDSHIVHDSTNDRLVIHGNNGLLIDSDTYVGSVAITNLVATQGYVGSSINTAIDNYAATVASTYATKTQLADYLPLAGGRLNGDLHIGPNSSSNFKKIYFGDGSYVWLGEETDDSLTIQASKNVLIKTGNGYKLTYNGYEVFTENGGTVTGICSFENDVDVSGRLSLNTDSYFEVGDDDILYIYGDAGVYFYNRPFVGSLAASAQVALLSDLATYATITQLNTACDNLFASVVSNVTVSGNNLVVSKNGVNTPLTIPYATNAGQLGGYAVSYFATGSALLDVQENAVYSISAGTGADAGKLVYRTGGNVSTAVELPYLPLTAGSSKPLTGELYISGSHGIQWNNGEGMLVCRPTAGGWTGVSGTQWAVGTLTAQGVIRSDASDLLHYRSNTAYNIWDASNFTPSDYLPLMAGSSHPLTGDLYLSEDLVINNEKYIYFKNHSGTLCDALSHSYDSSTGIDTLYLGFDFRRSSHSTEIYGNKLTLFTGMLARERMVITSGGNVGIGTNAPDYKLDVSGVIRATEGIMVRNGTSDAIGFDTTAMFFNKAQTGGSPITSTVATFTWDNTNQRIVVGFSATPKVGTTEVALKSDISFASRQNNVLTLTTDFLVAAAGIECDDIIYASSDLKTGDSLYFGASASDDDGYGRLYADNSGNLWFQPTNGTAKRIAFV